MKYFSTLLLLFSLAINLNSSTTNGFHIESRIAHGHDAIPHSAPYIISLQVNYSNKYHHSCGGSILSEHWILTAGHCFNGNDNVKLRIVAGRHDVRIDSELSEQVREIHWYKVHDKYGGNVGPNDLALVYVAEPFIWNEAVQPIALPNENQNHSGMAILFGWGLLSHNNNDKATILQTADIALISYETCVELGAKDYLDSTNICTFDGSGASACSSDSGGPLVQMNSNSKIELIGVVSWGPPCGKPNSSYSAYVKVSSFIEWISDVQKAFNSSF